MRITEFPDLNRSCESIRGFYQELGSASGISFEQWLKSPISEKAGRQRRNFGRKQQTRMRGFNDAMRIRSFQSGLLDTDGPVVWSAQCTEQSAEAERHVARNDAEWARP
jgi:hypothetical protein